MPQGRAYELATSKAFRRFIPFNIVIKHPAPPMRVRELIDLLKRFDPQASVRLSIAQPDRVLEIHEHIWVGDYGGGPQINAVSGLEVFHLYVGCGLEQMVASVPREFQPDLGRYDNPEDAAKVHDFYVIHRGLELPLRYPAFDYEHWIPPRTTSGQYNPLIAQILREKLMRE